MENMMLFENMLFENACKSLKKPIKQMQPENEELRKPRTEINQLSKSKDGKNNENDGNKSDDKKNDGNKCENNFFDTFSKFADLIRAKVRQMEKRKSDYISRFEDELKKNKIKKNQYDLLKDNLEVTYKEETNLLKELLSENPIEFMKDIIRIENLFNFLFKNLKEQKEARKQCEPDITKYCKKDKPLIPYNTISELNSAMNSCKSKFEKFIEKIKNSLKNEKIRVVNLPEASLKDNKRIFYKAYYIYNGDIKQMSDCLRCAFAFQTFNDLYRALEIVKNIANKKCTDGILRVKDLFHQDGDVPFGYRHILVNVYCPGTQLVCELQLHIQSFYNLKDNSHKIYKIARLFEEGDDNLIYKLAKQNISSINEIPQPKPRDEEFAILLKEWKLSQFIEQFRENGWTSVDLWKDLSKNEQELQNMNMKWGHIKLFQYNVNLKTK